MKIHFYICITLLTILVLLFGFVIRQQQVWFNQLDQEFIAYKTRKDNNDKIIYRYMIKHEVTIRLLKNGFDKW